MLPITAFAGAVAAMSAQNIGACYYTRARSVMWNAVRLSLGISTVIFILVQITPETFTSLFSNDPAVIAAGAAYLRTYVFDCILVSFIFNMNGYFSSYGKSMFVFIHSAIATFLVRIPMTRLTSSLSGGNLSFVGLAAPTATALSLIICLFYLRHIKKAEQELECKEVECKVESTVD
jgi:Na+-driven multidrug efflux pump